MFGKNSMAGVWLEQGELRYRQDLPVPAVAEGEALVKVRLAGVCATDLQLLRGYYPFCGIPGHEFVGEVAAAPGQPSWLGRRVCGEINIGCGVCPDCRQGLAMHCRERQALGIKGRDGAFAEYLRLPLANLHAVPDSVADECAVFCEPLAAALAILQAVHLCPCDAVLIVGAGRLGQLIARVLRLLGCRLALVVRHEQQRRLAEAVGVACLAEDEVPPQEFAVAVEASGAPGGLQLARRAVRPRGTVVLKSTFHGDTPLNLSPLVVDEVRLVGSRCGPFAPALRLLEQGLVDPRPLIDAVLPLAQGVDALAQAARPGALKVLLRV